MLVTLSISPSYLSSCSVNIPEQTNTISFWPREAVKTGKNGKSHTFFSILEASLSHEATSSGGERGFLARL